MVTSLAHAFISSLKLFMSVCHIIYYPAFSCPHHHSTPSTYICIMVCIHLFLFLSSIISIICDSLRRGILLALFNRPTKSKLTCGQIASTCAFGVAVYQGSSAMVQPPVCAQPILRRLRYFCFWDRTYWPYGLKKFTHALNSNFHTTICLLSCMAYMCLFDQQTN